MNLSQVTNLGGLAWTWAAEFIPNLLVAILVVMAGFYIAGLASRGIRTLLSRSSHSDTTLVPVLAAVVRYAITIFVVIAALSQLGVETTSLLAILGAAGLAVGLALQGTLANIAAGIMLLWLRPFRVGDYIEVSSAAGTVEEINLFHSRLRTWDGIYKFVPNSQLWNTTLTNYTRNRTRLILIEFGIAYEDDIATGRAVLAEQAINHPSVLNDPSYGAWYVGLDRQRRFDSIERFPNSFGKATASAVALNVTVTGPTAPSHLTIWPTGQAMPTASNLNFVAGQTVPNHVVVKLGSGGSLNVLNNSGNAHVIVDVVGWYS